MTKGFSEKHLSFGGKPRGFISIIALAMFLVMMIVVMDVQMNNIDTLNSIRARDNYLTANILSDSIVEFVQFKMKNHTVGWNTGKISCGFGKFAAQTTMVNEEKAALCEDPDLLDMVLHTDEAKKDIKIEIELKSRLEPEQKLATTQCKAGAFLDMNDNCYVVPFPKTGTVNDTDAACKRYRPSYVGDSDASPYVESFLANKSTTLDQLDYSCNWDKLQFGSSTLDRVIIPLYYDQSGAETGEIEVVSPFYADDLGLAEADDLILRIRTPCVPCGQKPSKDGLVRVCEAYTTTSGKVVPKVDDETVCADSERYVLRTEKNGEDDDDDDIVLSWAVAGLCKDEKTGKDKDIDCVMVGIPEKVDKQGKKMRSAIYESRINDEEVGFNHILLSSAKDYKTYGYDTNLRKEVPFIDQLKKMKQPTLTLLLNHPLLTDKQYQFVPHLEYQLLTDKPISNPKAILRVMVLVGDNSSLNILEMDVRNNLIEFTVKN